MDNDLSRVVDALPGLVWSALPDGSVDFLNQRWCEYTGLTVEQASGGGWQSTVHPDDLPELLSHWRSTVATGEPREMDARMRRVDGEYRRFLLRVAPMTDANGKIVRWCGMNTDIEDRRRSEEALHARWWMWQPAREQHFRTIIDDLPTLAMHMTPGGDLEHVNRQVLEYFDASLDELKTLGLADVVHPDDVAAVIAAWNLGLQSNQRFDLECRLRRADGVFRRFEGRPFPLRDAAGEVVLWYFLLHDIDDGARAEALLAGEKHLLEMVARSHSMTPILETLCRLVEHTVEGCRCSVVLVDSSGKRLGHGAAPSLPATFIASIIGRSVNNESGPCATAAFLNEQVIAADLDSETRWSDEGWCSMALRHGLKSCWSTPIASKTGQVLGAFAIYFTEPGKPTSLHQSLIERFTHIASIAIERSQQDAVLRRSQAFLLRAQHLSLTGSYAWNVATGETTWSEQLYRIYEFEQGTTVTQDRVRDRYHPEDLSLLDQMIAQANSVGSDLEYEHRLCMPDGSTKFLQVVAHGARNDEGQLEYIGAVRDVTDRRHSDDAIEKARSELAHVARVTTLGALAASIAHEVNQPLSGIITNASTCIRMLTTDPPNVHGACETARRTLRDGNRAADVINRLRALFVKRKTTTETVDLNEATREVIALSKSELQRRCVISRAELAADLPPVDGDRVQLQQVILNLLLNASDSMIGIEDRPRQLVIKTEPAEDDRVRLTVQDVGVGIGSHNAERLFDAFYTTKPGGMGIGLSVSRSIIESHRGHLWATPNDGPGTTFHFSIPRRMSEGTSIGGRIVTPCPVAPSASSS